MMGHKPSLPNYNNILVSRAQSHLSTKSLIYINLTSAFHPESGTTQSSQHLHSCNQDTLSQRSTPETTWRSTSFSPTYLILNPEDKGLEKQESTDSVSHTYHVLRNKQQRQYLTVMPHRLNNLAGQTDLL